MEPSVPPTDGDPLPEVIAGRYRVVRELARGGMGVVLVVEHLGTGAELALKLMSDRLLSSPRAVARFKREARAPAQIRSDHVVRVIDADTAPELGGVPFLVMELLDGEDLDKLGEQGPLPPDSVVEWLRQAARGLDRAHAMGIVHRDLKPANLFLARQPEGPPIVKVVDFGVVKMLQDPDAVESGAIVGTPQFMSPEQVVAARGKVTAASDVWAMGHVAFNLLSGRHYWLGEGPLQLISEILHGAMPVPSERGCDLGPAFDDWFLKSCARAPEHRFASVGEQIEALAVALANEPSAAGAVTSVTEDVSLAPSASPAVTTSTAAGTSSTMAKPSAVEALQALAAAPVRPRATRQGAPPRLTLAEDETLADDELPTEHARQTSPTPPPRPLDDDVAQDGASSRRALWLGIAGAVVVGGAVAALVATVITRRDEDASRSTVIDAERLASFAALPAVKKHDDALISLGQKLFADRRLSRNGDVACTSCHDLDKAGTDGQRRSRGTGGVETARNTPSVLNLPGSFAFSWDGRQEDLLAQAKEVLASPSAMATSPAALESKLRETPEYVDAFAKAFPGEASPLSFDNVARALVAYEETLQSPARWDRFLAGDVGALTDDEKAGFNRFVDIGCVTCHFGPHVGATMFQKAGLVKAWPDTLDRGRYEITKRDTDLMVFRVPSLRNVAVTAPYFHDGSVDSLDTAVRMMGHHQLGKTLEDRDVALLSAWLGSLTGEAAH